MGSASSIVNQIAFPRPPRNLSGAALLKRSDLVWIKTATARRLPAIHVRSARRPAPLTLVYSHGNAEDVGLSLAYIDYLVQTLRVDVLAYEYLGYSLADGDPSEAALYESADAAWDYLTVECGVPATSIVLFGRSLGSAPAVHIAARHPAVAGLVLQSPLSSGSRVLVGIAASYALKLVDPFQNYAKIGRVRCRTLIMHGTVDEVVPYWHGQSLHDALAQRNLAATPFWADGCGHNNMPEGLCIGHIAAFIATLASPQSGALEGSTLR
jgi:fermentation-respiration switch protein FrsA (DUF1100 family)